MKTTLHIAPRLRRQRLKTCLIASSLALGLASTAFAQTRVSSLRILQRYLNDSNVNVKLDPGTYTVTADDISSGRYGRFIPDNGLGALYVIFPIEGNNSTYDFTGCTINIDTEAFRAVGRTNITEVHTFGNDNVLRNLTLVDIGDSAPFATAQNIIMDGEDNRIEGFRVTVRGSYPYGYGDIFGKGSNRILNHRKHSACLIRGNSNHLKNCRFTHRAYGHGIFFQAARDAVVEGCYLEGQLSTTSAVLAEAGSGSPADEVNFETVWGYNLREVGNYRFSLQEDGIRAYRAGTTVVNGHVTERTTGNLTIRNCEVRNMRSGVGIGLANGTTQIVDNVTALGCESGFWAADRARVTNCRGDASVGPLVSEDASRSNARYEVTLLDDSVRKIGDTPSFHLAGRDHNITITNGTSSFNRSINIQVGGGRNGHRWLAGSETPLLNFSARDLTIVNSSTYPARLESNSSGIDFTTCGSVTNRGSGNTIRECESSGGSTIVTMRKRNATAFSIDGGRGGANGQNIYLWSTNSNNVNQQFEEVSRGGGYYSYQKRNTSHSIDGGNGGRNNQNVYLWSTDARNYNQQWRKVSMGGGAYKLIKRNAPYTINGGGRGANGQNVNLYTSSSNHQNLQWIID